MTLIRPSVRSGSGLAVLVVAWWFSWPAAAEVADNRTAQGQGEELFLREWVAGDPRSHGGDGLGPLYNETSCVACHNLGARGGAGPSSKNVEILTLLTSLAARETDQIQEYHPGFRSSPSVVLHRFGTDPEYTYWKLRRTVGVELADMAEQGDEAAIKAIQELVGIKVSAREKNVSLRTVTGLPPGSSRVKGAVLFVSVSTLARRNPPPLFGAGLIDSIPIQSLREAASHSAPGVRGRLNTLKGGRVGRFGWKAQTPSLKDFVESACAMELGLEVPTHHQARSPLDFSKTKPGLDLTQDECDALTAYVAGLPAPIERGAIRKGEEPPDRAAGRELFSRVGCAECHLPKLGSVEGIYTDLLLHDMGMDLSDSGSYYGAIELGSVQPVKSTEWRTPPLWGFRDSGPYLHDGRADTLEEAVALHGGQAQQSSKEFFALKPRERLQVQTFLNSLAAPPVVPLR